MIDTTSVLIKQPLKYLTAYTDRKSTTSVKIQAVCDSRKMILDVSVGWPGFMHDARIYNISSLYRVIHEILGGTNFYIIGDMALEFVL